MIFGNISGANINPIVTISFWIYNGNLFSKYNLTKLISYLLAQFIGVLLGNIFSRYISDHDIIYVVPKNTEWHKQFTTEAFFSGTLVFIAFFISSSSTRPTNKNYINLTLLATWLYVICRNGGDISGGNFNPTVYIIFNGMAKYYDGINNAYDEFLIMVFSPIFGGIIFMFIFKFLFRPYYIKNHKKCITEIE